MQKSFTDYVQLSPNRYFDKDTGYLVCENAVLGSIGYQEYKAYELNIDTLPPNTIIKVFRPEEEVFKEESLNSLENKAICLLHPDVDVTAENDSQLRKGMVYNVHRDGSVIKGDLMFTDKSTIDKTSYIKCLSLGYNMCLEPMKTGDNDDGTTFIASHIKYNHIALVPKGRSKVAKITDALIDKKNIKEENMSLFSKKIEDADVKDDETKAEKDKVEKRDEKSGAEEDTVTKEIEKRVEKGDISVEDLEKLLAKLKKGDDKEIKNDYEARKDEEKDKKKVDDKDDKKDDDKKANDSITISQNEYKELVMAKAGLHYANDSDAFEKKDEKQVKTIDAEEERRLYYKNSLNPHRNKDYSKECGTCSELLNL